MAYKYQALFDELGLDGCPSNVTEVNIKAYRWTHDPIESGLNFLPNVLYDRAQRVPLREIAKDGICNRCGISFFTTLETAADKLTRYRSYLERKHQSIVNRYNHIAEGQIFDTDGRSSLVVNDHFSFYEYENCNFPMKFKNILPI